MGLPAGAVPRHPRPVPAAHRTLLTPLLLAVAQCGGSGGGSTTLGETPGVTSTDSEAGSEAAPTSGDADTTDTTGLAGCDRSPESGEVVRVDGLE